LEIGTTRFESFVEYTKKFKDNNNNCCKENITSCAETTARISGTIAANNNVWIVGDIRYGENGVGSRWISITQGNNVSTILKELEYVSENTREEHDVTTNVINISFSGHNMTGMNIEKKIFDDVVIKIANRGTFVVVIDEVLS